MNQTPVRSGIRIPAMLLLCFACVAMTSFAQRPQPKPKPTGPWMNTSLSPDERADLVHERNDGRRKDRASARRGHADRRCR